MNKFLKSSPEIDSQAITFERIGGIDPLYSGAQIIHFSTPNSFSLTCCTSLGILLLEWILGLKSGIFNSVRSKISEVKSNVLIFAENSFDSSKFLPLLAEMIIISIGFFII